MLISKKEFLDTKLFNAFIAAAETENFTEAARMAFMTQPGISQHIAKLEMSIGHPLFKRVGSKVFLTDSGKELLSYIEEQSNQQTLFMNRIGKKHGELSGVVSYAMPDTCLFSDHFLCLLEKKAAHPELYLDVTLADSQTIFELLLNDKVHFGFVTYKIENPYLSFQHYCIENYIMVTGDKTISENFDLKHIFDYKYISYPGSDIYFNKWLKNYTDPKYNFFSLSKSGHINNIYGAIRMVTGKLGLAVFPRHCIQDKLDKMELFECNLTTQLIENDIYIAQLKNEEQPRRVEQVIQWFNEMVVFENAEKN